MTIQPKQNKTVKLNLLTTPEERDQAAQVAKFYGVSTSELIRQLLGKAFQEYQAIRP